mmetsp:Transcript_57430/g.150815  ORF Transcript_57430/g.150815 Transcript_57430/m.150815 type:complete len:391 (+) Transcript_57430:1513-2685(+)
MRICCCCTVETSVQWPCRIISTHERIDGSLEVKGAAMDASPNLTIGNSPVSPSIMSSCAADAPATPCFCASACCSLASSWRSRVETAMVAPSCAETPVSPRAARAATSSSSHCRCLPISSARFALNSAACTLALSARFLASSADCASSAFSASAAALPSLPLSAPSLLSAFTLPKPESSEMPTSAVLSAPTSLPPSPHMSTFLPFFSCNIRITLALPCGDMRAKTLNTSRQPHSAGCAAAASSRDASVAIRSYLAASWRTVAASKGSTVSSEPPTARTQRGPASPSHVSSSSGLSAAVGAQMATSRATCRAVSGASPVSMPIEWAESSKARTTAAESARVLHAKAIKPAKVRSVSTCSRGRAAAAASLSHAGSGLEASARTRMPRSAIDR